MKHMMLTAAPLLALLSACGGTGAEYVPISDGAPKANFQADLAQCQDLSRQKPLVDGETREDALVGGAIGALAGVADSDTGNLEGAVAGAVVGGLAGGTAGTLERREDRADIVVDCMKGRGHAVVG